MRSSPDSLDLQKVLLSTFGQKNFRDGQKDVIRAILDGRDVFGRMPTGSGKSLCFQLPATLSEGTTIVISPLIALMRDQIRGLLERGISATDLHSGYDEVHRRSIMRKIHEKVFRLVYVAPEQLLRNDFLDLTAKLDIPHVVVDEAHCISDWGHDFRPSYRQIPGFAKERNVPQTLAFTATASRQVITDTERLLLMEDPYEYIADPFRLNLNYQVQRANNDREKAAHLLSIIKENEKLRGGILIYCSTRKEVLAVFDFLKKAGLPVAFYHGGLPDDKRKEAENNFYDNKTKILVATNAFGMGVDKADIRLIIHFNMPGNIESYLQETGRAGRDQKESSCVLLFQPNDAAIHRFLQLDNNPTFNIVSRVFYGLKRQSKAKKDGAGFFEPNLKSLASFVIKSRSAGNAVTASMSILEEFGIIERKGKLIRMKDLRHETEIKQFTERKKASAEVRLQKMVQYAEDGNPDQRLLIDLFELV